MKKIHSVILRFLLVAVTLAGSVSCVKEDTDGCVDSRGNVRLTLDLEAGTAARSTVPTLQIDSIHVYVFDAADKFVTSCKGGKYTDDEYEFFLTLDSGDYHFVVWTNPCNYYKTNTDIDNCVAGVHSLDQLYLFLDHSYEGCLTEDIPDLFHGMVKSKPILADRHNEVRVLMTPNTYRINVVVEGLPADTDQYGFTITDNNSHYTFENSIIAGQGDFTHTRTSGFENGELTASMKVLQLANDRHPQFEFFNSTQNESLYSNDLVAMIRQAYADNGQQVDFAATHEFNIVLSVDARMNVSVTVNGWSYSYQPGTLE